jgi:hypothetical protein
MKAAHAILSSAAWQETGVLCVLCKGWENKRHPVGLDDKPRLAPSILQLIIPPFAENAKDGAPGKQL